MSETILKKEVIQNWRRPIRNNETFYISLPKRLCRKHHIDTKTTIRIIAVENTFLMFPEDSLKNKDFEKRIERVLSALLSDQKEKEEKT